MKKSIFIVLAALILTSCATLPKQVKPNETLLVGCVSTSVFGYKQEYKKLNDEKNNKIELTIKDTNSIKEFLVKPNKDGLFIVKGLNPASSYKITRMKLIAETNDGASWVTIDFPNPTTFKPLYETVNNVGLIRINFNGQTNMCYWSIEDHAYVKRKFLTLAKDEESEWAEKEFYNIYRAF